VPVVAASATANPIAPIKFRLIIVPSLVLSAKLGGLPWRGKRWEGRASREEVEAR